MGAARANGRADKRERQARNMAGREKECEGWGETGRQARVIYP